MNYHKKQQHGNTIIRDSDVKQNKLIKWLLG